MYAGPSALKDYIDYKRIQLEDGYCLTHLWRSESYKRLTQKGVTGPLRQAYVFAHMLDQHTPILNPGEAIVGSTQGALSTVLPENVSEEEYKKAERFAYEESCLSFEWHYDHACPDYENLVTKGVSGLISHVEEQYKNQYQRQLKKSQTQYLDAMHISFIAFQRFISKYARECSCNGLIDHSRRLHNLIDAPPTCFWEALQLIWFADLVFVLEGRGAMAFGRMDQYLYPFYKYDIESGKLTPDQALLLLAHFYAKLGEPLRPNPINNISIGGFPSDTGIPSEGGFSSDWNDGANELSLLFLEAANVIRSPRHNLTARWNLKTPKWFKEACFDLLKTGIGFPAIVNDEVLIKSLVRMGLPLEDAVDCCFVGCIETFLQGKTGPWCDTRFNMLKVLEDLLYKLIKEPHLLPATYGEFQDLYMSEMVNALMAHAEEIRQAESEIDFWECSSPFLSVLTCDCIYRATDVNTGGARYTAMTGVAGMGLATVADSLNSIRVAVYEKNKYSLAELVDILRDDFQNRERDRLYLLNRIPKYGNGEALVDNIARTVATTFGQTVLSLTNALGGRILPLLAANISNIGAGKEVGATPDGRHAYTPLSDAASPHFGRDRQSPAGVIASLSKIDYINSMGGNVVNMKISLSGHPGEREAFIAFLTTYFRKGGLQMQFNTTDVATLIEAQRKPENYENLIVRVSGFSSNFTHLAKEVQDDIISRTEHQFGNKM